jgi:hypothetical protein
MTDDRRTGTLKFGAGEEYEREIQVFEPGEPEVFALIRASDMMHDDNAPDRKLLALQVFGDALESLIVDTEDVGYLFRGIIGRRIPLDAYAALAADIVKYWGKGETESAKPGARRKQPSSRR